MVSGAVLAPVLGAAVGVLPQHQCLCARYMHAAVAAGHHVLGQYRRPGGGLLGAGLLLLAYVGSRFVMEVVLGRST